MDKDGKKRTKGNGEKNGRKVEVEEERRKTLVQRWNERKAKINKWTSTKKKQGKDERKLFLNKLFSFKKKKITKLNR